ncbi:hypothetical protein [Photobacterium sanctipauli]|nr:hypothetical protein [Photobacterium sanctipauli]
MYTMAITGFIAAGWEVVNIFEHWKNTDSLSERSLLLIKGSGLGANILVFGITIFNTSSQYSIAAIIAPWMVTALFWGGLVVLIASLLLSIIKKSPIEKWLVRCLWGNENRNWSIEKELSEYQKIIYQPQAKIIKSNRQCIRQPVYNSPGLYSIHKTIQIQLPDSSMNFALTISGQTTNTILNGRWVTHQEQRYFEVDISYTSAYANITISLQYTDIPFFNYTLSASKQGGFIIASTVPANQQNLIELQASL